MVGALVRPRLCRLAVWFWRSYAGVVLAAFVCVLYLFAGDVSAADRPTPQNLTKWKLTQTARGFDTGFTLDRWEDGCSTLAADDCQASVGGTGAMAGKCVRLFPTTCSFDQYDRNGTPAGSGNWRRTGSITYSITSSTVLTCPAGFNASNGECVCPGGQTWNGQSCVGSCITSSAAAAQSYAKAGLTSELPANGKTCHSDGCVWGWSYKYVQQFGAIDRLYGSHPYPTGKTCAEDTVSTPTVDPYAGEGAPSRCSPGQCPGQSYNGQTVCVPCGQSESKPQEVKNSDGTSTEKQTVCVSGTCTTTEIKKTGGIETSRTSISEPHVDYCSRNPLSPQCSGITNNGQGAQNVSGGAAAAQCEGEECPPDASFGGNCASSFTCSGDAVQCAIAKDQHVRHCQLFEDPNPLSSVGGEAMNGEAKPTGHPGNSASSVSVAFSSSINTTNTIGGGCPADYTFAYAGGSLTIPFGSACGEFQALGTMLVAFSMLAAAFIVFRN